MDVFFIVFGATSVFYILYKLIVIHGKRVTYTYFAVSQILLAFGILKFVINDWSNFFSWLVVQVSFVLFTIGYFKDERRTLYECMGNCNFNILFSIGFIDLSKQEIDECILGLEKFFNEKY